MNATLSENRFWYCDLCDKRISIRSESKRFISKSHKHKKKYGFVVEEYELIKPENDELKSILNDTIRNCRNKNFLIHLTIDVYIILNLCKWKIMRKLFYQLHAVFWNLNLIFLI